MANTYDIISTTTLGSGQSSVTLSSIPQTYTDIVIVCSNLVTNNNPYPNGTAAVRFNGDTGSNYSLNHLGANGTFLYPELYSNQTYMNPWYFPTGGLLYVTMNLMNYSNTTNYKTVLSQVASGSNGPDFSVGMWRSTAAITSVNISQLPEGSGVGAGSTFTLYGIKAA